MFLCGSQSKRHLSFSDFFDWNFFVQNKAAFLWNENPKIFLMIATVYYEPINDVTGNVASAVKVVI